MLQFCLPYFCSYIEKTVYAIVKDIMITMARQGQYINAYILLQRNAILYDTLFWS